MSNSSGNLKIGTKSFISTVAILLGLMIFAGILTQVLPQGSFERVVDDNGYEMVVEGSYTLTENAEKLPVWRWFTAPFELFGDSQSLTAIVIIVFIILVGGTFSILEKADVFRYLIAATIKKFGNKKYFLLCIVTLICMLLGSTMGLLEETVPLVPILVLLSLAFGWDTLIGLGMSIMAVGFGFAAGTFNPFTVVVAQKLADVPLFSGLSMRVVAFVLIYTLTCIFLVKHAKKVEKNPEKSFTFTGDEEKRKNLQAEDNSILLQNKNVSRAAVTFGLSMVLILCYVVTALAVPALSDYTMVVMAVVITLAGIIAGRISKYKEEGMAKDFLSGMLSMAPGAVLIILSMSVRFIIEKGGIMDTILNWAYTMMKDLSPIAAILIVYLIVLIIQFFISGAASKAFLIMPLIVPLADMIGLTRQSIVLAFQFGDGFTNVFFPTNALLLIVLGLVSVPYSKWFRWTWKLQTAILAVTAVLLLIAVKIGY